MSEAFAWVQVRSSDLKPGDVFVFDGTFESEEVPTRLIHDAALPKQTVYLRGLGKPEKWWPEYPCFKFVSPQPKPSSTESGTD